MAKAIVVDFDIFSMRGCPYFEPHTSVNDGYGCRHPDCDDFEEDDNGQDMGCCRLSGCPLCSTFDEDALHDLEIDKDGHKAEDFLDAQGDFIDDGDHAVVYYSTDKSAAEMEALGKYQRYLCRYEKP